MKTVFGVAMNGLAMNGLAMNESTYVTPRNSDQSSNFLKTGPGKDSRARHLSVVIKSLQLDIRDYSSTQTETRTENG